MQKDKDEILNDIKDEIEGFKYCKLVGTGVDGVADIIFTPLKPLVKTITYILNEAGDLDDHELASFMKHIEKCCLERKVSREDVEGILTGINMHYDGRFKEFLCYNVLVTTIEEDLMDVLIGE